MIIQYWEHMIIEYREPMIIQYWEAKIIQYREPMIIQHWEPMVTQNGIDHISDPRGSPALILNAFAIQFCE